MATLTEDNVLGDVLKWACHRGYCLESKVIEGSDGAGSGVELFVGDVMRLGTGAKLIPVSAATGADAVAVLLEPVAEDDATGDVNRLCLTRGPALIDTDKLVFTVSDTQATAAKAALATLLMRDSGESATWSEQST